MKRLVRTWKRTAQRFAAQERGSVLILFALGAVVLIGSAGLGIDLGRQQIMRARIQQAADAAATSAASLTNNSVALTIPERNAAAVRYFYLNFPEDDPTAPIAAPDANSDTSSVTVTASAPVTTAFVSLLGFPTLPASGKSVVGINSLPADYDVVMVIDETGSTSGPISDTDPAIRIEVMRSALTNMVNSLLPPSAPNPNIRIGIMGYSSHITSKWGLSSNNADVINAVNHLSPTCNNYDHWGMEGDKKMILGGTPGTGDGNYFIPATDPIWGGVYNCGVEENTDAPTPRTPRSDGDAISGNKDVIFLTDGDIMTDPAPCIDYFRPGPPGSYNCYADATKRNYKLFTDECALVRATGAHVYVVNFASPPATAEAAMRECASPKGTDPTVTEFYNAPDVSTLTDVLTHIAGSVRKVRIQH